MKLFNCLFSFLLRPKKKQKRAPENYYIQFSGSSLIKLQYYCKLSFCNSTFERRSMRILARVLSPAPAPPQPAGGESREFKLKDK